MPSGEPTQGNGWSDTHPAQDGFTHQLTATQSFTSGVESRNDAVVLMLDLQGMIDTDTPMGHQNAARDPKAVEGRPTQRVAQSSTTEILISTVGNKVVKPARGGLQ